MQNVIMLSHYCNIFLKNFYSFSAWDMLCSGTQKKCIMEDLGQRPLSSLQAKVVPGFEVIHLMLQYSLQKNQGEK